MLETADLSQEQSAAVDAVCDWHASSQRGGRQHFRLGGLAGTGKTTLLPHVVRRLGIAEERVAFAAFTGKAARVMVLRGVLRASTIHRLIYQPEEVVLPGGKRGVRFTKKQELDFPASLVVVDEASMVTEEIHRDLMSFGAPTLYVGDYGQLPPVGDPFNLMEEARLDAKLSTIHRQAESNPIVRVAMDVREGRRPAERSADGRFAVMPKSRVPESSFDAADQILVGFNESRKRINADVRRMRGLSGALPLRGERLILLRNNREYGVANGQQCVMVEDASQMDTLTLLARTVDDWAWEDYNGLAARVGAENVDIASLLCGDLPTDVEVRTLPLQRRCFEPVGFEETQYEALDRVAADFAYAITVHKSQGSEWNKVLLWDDGFGRDEETRRRWLYTAVTRAKERLIWAV